MLADRDKTFEARSRNKTSEEVNLFERKASEAQERPEMRKHYKSAQKSQEQKLENVIYVCA